MSTLFGSCIFGVTTDSYLSFSLVWWQLNFHVTLHPSPWTRSPPVHSHLSKAHQWIFVSPQSRIYCKIPGFDSSRFPMWVLYNHSIGFPPTNCFLLTSNDFYNINVSTLCPILWEIQRPVAQLIEKQSQSPESFFNLSSQNSASPMNTTRPKYRYSQASKSPASTRPWQLVTTKFLVWPQLSSIPWPILPHNLPGSRVPPEKNILRGTRGIWQVFKPHVGVGGAQNDSIEACVCKGNLRVCLTKCLRFFLFE